MAHPRMYDPDDPALARVRAVCLALPAATEVEAWGRPTFRIGKIFALYSGTPERPVGLFVKPEPDERPALLADDRFYSPPYFGPGGWVALDLEREPVDWDEVAELIESSYRQVAPKRRVAELDAMREA